MQLLLKEHNLLHPKNFYPTVMDKNVISCPEILELTVESEQEE